MCARMWIGHRALTTSVVVVLLVELHWLDWRKKLR